MVSFLLASENSLLMASIVKKKDSIVKKKDKKDFYITCFFFRIQSAICGDISGVLGGLGLGRKEFGGLEDFLVSEVVYT